MCIKQRTHEFLDSIQLSIELKINANSDKEEYSILSNYKLVQMLNKEFTSS